MNLARPFLARWRQMLDGALAQDSLSAAAQRVLLGLTLGICLVTRLATIGAPALDRTAWKEIDYIQVSTNYWQHGFRFLCPEVSWPAEGPRCTAMELPIVPYLAALGYGLLGINPLSVRLITLLSFTLLPLVVFRIARPELGPAAGCVAALACAAMPLYHPFGRFLFSEPPMILCSAMALLLFAEWLDSRSWTHWFGAMSAFSLAVALKLEPLYLLLPLAWLAATRLRGRLWDYRAVVALVLAALVLPALWYAWAWHLGSTSLDVFGILRGHDKFQTLAMLADLDWYRTMRWRVGAWILGGKVGMLLAAVGLLAAAALRRGGVFWPWLIAVLSSFVIVAEGNIDAPYRQLPIVPPLAGFVAMGALALSCALLAAVDSIVSRAKWRRRTAIVAMALALVAFVPLKRRLDVMGHTADVPVHADQWDLAQAVRAHVGRDGKLVAIQEYTIHKGGNDLSPVLYHYSGLPGWTLQKGDWNQPRLDALIGRGATHLAVSSMSHDPEAAPFIEELRRRYQLLYGDQARGLLLLDLRHPSARGL